MKNSEHSEEIRRLREGLRRAAVALKAVRSNLESCPPTNEISNSLKISREAGDSCWELLR